MADEPEPAQPPAPPVVLVEGRRVQVGFLRLGPEPERTIRERYEHERQLGMNRVGQRWLSQAAQVRVVVNADTGLWRGFWVGQDGRQRLGDLGWQEREHLRGALQDLVAEIDSYDREDARDLTGRHEGHHIHLNATYSSCSCNDKCIISIHSGVPPRHPERLSCDICGATGVVASPRHFKED